ncbi:Transcription initiation factor IIE subunit beta [Ophiocordyceps camponoti-floridani]|uniref:Transcription initiation factor IIE subunit beta n=1 Tax=Ophiocordyceps camponoti-floridani TaxID=2030778 RepID=A0A8H4QDP7_9HYPO|nr:Transcription initiation factor IIE subunit beta [Ophiocordyceps camponoti-floridani]
MPSYLEKQSSAFRGTLASAASKLSNAKTSGGGVKAVVAAASSLAPPSPSPSAASDSATPTTTTTTTTGKRKREAGPDVPFSQPQLTGYGAEVKTQMTFAVEYLKKKGEAKTMTDVIDHLSLRAYSDQHKRELADGLRGHPRVEWRPDTSLAEQSWRTGTYSHRPIIPGVRDATSLLAFLQRKTDASGVSVKDLKDGWPDCEEALSSLEGQNKVLVVRTKKDNFPRYVWLDDPSLKHRVQPEFQTRWHHVPLPSLEDMHRKLVSVGQKPTSDDPRKAVQGAVKPKAQKKKAGKKVGKATNVHMAHLMQDYSGMRR